MKTTTDRGVPVADELARLLNELPTRPSAAVRVLAMINEDGSSAAELGRLISADPALTARIIRLANSPYYGLSREVSSAAHAVMVIGMESVRALAATVAAGLYDSGRSGMPEGFWDHSAAVAAAASILAERSGLSSTEAMSLGLLHELGAALLHKLSPSRYRVAITRNHGGLRLSDAEADEFGMGHDEVGAMVLNAWHFPPAFVDAVRHHHQWQLASVGSTPDLARVLIAAEALVRSMEHPANDGIGRHLAVIELDCGLAAVGVDAPLETLHAAVLTRLGDLNPLLS